METIVWANFYVFIVVGGIGIFTGLEIKKWTDWLYGVYGFLSGFLLGLLLVGVYHGLKLGAFIAFGVMYLGVTSRWVRKHNK